MQKFLSEHLLFNLLFDLFRHVNVSTVQLAKIPHPTLSQQAIQGHGHWIYKGTEEWNGNDLKGGKLNRVELLILVEILFRLWEKNKLQYLTGYCRTIYEHSMQKKESINDFLSLTLRSTTSNPDSWTHLKHSKATLRGRERGKHTFHVNVCWKIWCSSNSATWCSHGKHSSKTTIWPWPYWTGCWQKIVQSSPSPFYDCCFPK